MAGHSKWANIRFRKAGQDAKRGKLFTRLTRAILLAAKEGGVEVENNPSLRNAIDKALSGNMTRDAIDRALKKAAGNLDGKGLDFIRYEGYGPDGVAVIVDCMSDNKNRTVSEVRHAFSKHGGNLGTDGSVAYMFKKAGHILIEPGPNEDRVLELVLELGGEEIQLQDDGGYFIETTPQSLFEIKDALIAADMKVRSADERMVAGTMTQLNKEQSEKVIKLIDRLEDLDDVQDVHTNADFDEEFLNDME